MYKETNVQDFESLIRKLQDSDVQKGQEARKDSDTRKAREIRNDSRQTDKKQVNRFGSPYGEEREVVIRYRISDEENAVLSVHSDGAHGAAEDSLAVAYTLGQLTRLSLAGDDTLDISAKAISTRVIDAMMDGIVEEMRKSLLRIIEKEVAKWE